MDNILLKTLLLTVAVIVSLKFCIKHPIEFKHDIKASEAIKKIFYKEVESLDKVAPESKMEHVEGVKHVLVNRGVPREASGEVKTYMGYKSITSKSSLQYKLQQECYTDEYAFRRYGEFYCVAMGKFYSDHVGSKFLITFDTGVQIKVIVGDVKMAQHTDDSLRYVEKNGNIVEFIMDSKKISKLIKITGDVSNSDNGLMKGKITKIEQIMEE